MLKFGPLSHNMLGNKYLLGELLGVGGFGAVYKAQNVLLDRPQAIKVVTAQAIDDPKGRERFSREARTLANLEHAHIIPVHDFDFDVAKNIVYLVMPYVEGGTLEELLRSRGALPLQEVDFYFEQMCTALDYAHEHDVVHLDLKPANMLLRKDGRTLLLSDFGLAHLVKEDSIEGGTSLNFGTPSYMSPEQISGLPQRSSDIYALGVILYRMLSGQLPYKGSSIMVEHLQAPIPHVSLARPDIPVELDQLIEIAMAKKPEDRFRSAGALLRSFRQTIAPIGTQISTSKAPSNPTGLFPASPKDVSAEPVAMFRETPVPQPLQPQEEVIVKTPSQPEPEPLYTENAAFEPVSELASQQQQQELVAEVPAQISAASPREKRRALRQRIYYTPGALVASLFPLGALIGAAMALSENIQSQVIVVGAVLLLGFVLYWWFFHKTLSFMNFFLLLLLSGVFAYMYSGVAQSNMFANLFSTYGGGAFDHTYYAIRQFNAGIIAAIPLPFFLYLGLFGNNNNKDSLTSNLAGISIWSFMLSCLCWFVVAFVGSLTGWGFGYGPAWYLGFLGIIPGVLLANGLGDIFNIAVPPSEPKQK